MILLTEMTSLEATLARTSVAELAVLGLVYSSVLSVHTRLSAPQYNKFFKKTSSVPLVLHIASGLWEVSSYHLQALAEPVLPARRDVLLCLIQSSTTLILAKPLRRGHARMTRPCYQAGAVLRPVITCIAYIAGSSDLHRSSVKILNGFVYTRILIWLLKRFRLVPSHQDMYNIGVFGAALIAISESSIRYGLHIYVCVAVSIALLNDRVSAKLRRLPGQQAPILVLLVRLGFSELETVRDVGKIGALTEPPADEYEEGFAKKNDSRAMTMRGAGRYRADGGNMALHKALFVKQPYYGLALAHVTSLISTPKLS